ncbi:hypothetical protein COOONC_02151, partial [Cooperia oncophora]
MFLLISVLVCLLQDCSEHLDSGKGSGIYLISPSGAVPFPVFLRSRDGWWRLDGYSEVRSPLTLSTLRSDYFCIYITFVIIKTCKQVVLAWACIIWLLGPVTLGFYGLNQTEITARVMDVLAKVTVNGGQNGLSSATTGTQLRPWIETTTMLARTALRHGITDFGWWHEKCGNVALNGLHGDTTALHRNMMFVYQNVTSGHKRR